MMIRRRWSSSATAGGENHHARQSERGHHRFQQHRAVADRPGVGFAAQLLRSRAGGDQRMKSGAGAAGDRDEQERQERFAAFADRVPAFERVVLNRRSRRTTRRSRPRRARRTGNSRPNARAAAAAATPARRRRPGNSRAAARPKSFARVIGLGERQAPAENAAPSSPMSNGMYWPIQITTPTSGTKITVAQPSDSRV